MFAAPDVVRLGRGLARGLALLLTLAAAGCLNDPSATAPSDFLNLSAEDSVLSADGVAHTEVVLRLDSETSARSYSGSLTLATTAGRFLEAASSSPQQYTTVPVNGTVRARLIAPDTSAEAVVTASGEGLTQRLPVRFVTALPTTVLLRSTAETAQLSGPPVVLSVTALRPVGQGVVSRNVRVELLAELADGTPLTELIRVQPFSAQQNETVSFSVTAPRPGTVRFRARLVSPEGSVTSEFRTVVFVVDG